jgi:hypothetical protein
MFSRSDRLGQTVVWDPRSAAAPRLLLANREEGLTMAEDANDRPAAAPQEAPAPPPEEAPGDKPGEAVRKGIDVLPTAHVPQDQAPQSGNLPPVEAGSSEGEAGDG